MADLEIPALEGVPCLDQHHRVFLNHIRSHFNYISIIELRKIQMENKSFAFKALTLMAGKLLADTAVEPDEAD